MLAGDVEMMMRVSSQGLVKGDIVGFLRRWLHGAAWPAGWTIFSLRRDEAALTRSILRLSLVALMYRKDVYVSGMMVSAG